jgi:hypothetical protein
MAVNNPTDLRPLIKAMNEFREAVDLRATRIEARLGPDNRAAWSAVGAAVMTVAAGAAVTLWLAAASVVAFPVARRRAATMPLLTDAALG